jgi:hypothetical protein
MLYRVNQRNKAWLRGADERLKYVGTPGEELGYRKFRLPSGRSVPDWHEICMNNSCRSDTLDNTLPGLGQPRNTERETTVDGSIFTE